MNCGNMNYFEPCSFLSIIGMFRYVFISECWAMHVYIYMRTPACNNYKREHDRSQTNIYIAITLGEVKL
jgi:hypothetical protein